MAYETLVAVYDTPDHADAAVKALKAAGFAESDISVFDAARLKAGQGDNVLRREGDRFVASAVWRRCVRA
jgi:hypothetical protein